MSHPPTAGTASRRAPPPSFEAGIWRLALACFVLAAGTGAALRFGVLHGLPLGLVFGDVRHAHSHLMFFSWVTPVAMAFSLALARRAGAREGGRWIAALALAGGLAAYGPFLLSGYGRLEVAGRELPLSMMTAGSAGVAWYLFAAFHLRSTRRLRRTTALLALDGAVALLGLASLAATALAAVGMAGLASTAWMPALIALFLESFGDGWFALALLALAHGPRVPAAPSGPARAGLRLLVAGLLLRGPARLAADVGAAWAEWPAALAALVAAAGLLMAVWPLLRDALARGANAWTAPLSLLAAKGVAEALLAWPPALAWSDAHGLHVVLLHAYLLGAVTLGLVAAARDLLGPGAAGAPPWLTVAVVTTVAALVPLTGVWPDGLGGPWALRAAAWTSLGPPLVVAASLAASAARRGA